MLVINLLKNNKSKESFSNNFTTKIEFNRAITIGGFLFFTITNRIETEAIQQHQENRSTIGYKETLVVTKQ